MLFIVACGTSMMFFRIRKHKYRIAVKSVFAYVDSQLTETFVMLFFIRQLLSHTERQFARPDTPQRASLVCSDPDLDVGDIP